MSRIAYVNGRYLPQRDAAVNIEDRGYQFADGVYEVVLIQDGRPVDQGLHLDRLDRSLRELGIPSPMGRASLLHVMGEVTRRNRIGDGIVYMQVTRGVARRDHAFPRPGTRPALVVTAKPVAPYPKDVERWTTSVITRPDDRWARCDIKSVSLLPNVLAKQAAREAGASEAILYDAAGHVTEGASSNAWIVDRTGTLRTRHLDHGILPGCTRAALATLLAENAIRFEERAFTREELRDAREVFLTSASSFVKPVTAVDGAPVADGAVGPVSRRLFALFAAHVQGGRNTP